MWGLRYGSWWLIQWALDGTVSLGVHVDPRRRQTLVPPDDRPGTYGPYVDLHLGPVIVSIGNNPARAGDVRYLTSVGIMRPEVHDPRG